MQQGRPLDSDRLELLAVQLESGRVYLIPRTVLENLVRAFPERAVQLIVSARPAGGPLAPPWLALGGGGVPGQGGCALRPSRLHAI